MVGLQKPGDGFRRPGWSERWESRRDVAHSGERWFAILGEEGAAVAQQDAQHSDDDLLHLGDPLDLLPPTGAGIPPFDHLVRLLFQFAKLVQEQQTGRAHGGASRICPWQPLYHQFHVFPEAFRLRKIDVAQEIPALLHHNQNGARGNKTAERRLRQEADGEGRLQPAHHDEREATDKRQKRGQLCPILDVRPGSELVRYQDCRNGTG
mmetsp:Transcript_96357/g.261707  ORF Transcript_96357/g.261707 Transcript_96357/m.261707 type:complete len:208 (-) Transcript_96357:224-847(-)